METVKVTLEMPKPIKDFLEAAHRFSKVEFSFEEWCYEQLIFGIKDGLECGDIDAMFPKLTNGKHLIEAYELDKVFTFKKEEEK